MHCSWLRLPVFLVALVSLGLSGCVGEVVQQAQTAAKRKQMLNELKALGVARFEFSDRMSRFPNSWEELESTGAAAGLRQKLEAEGYTVVFGMKVAEMTAGTSNFMHAYPRDARQNGGLVGLADGSVRQITAQEFQELWALQEPTMKNAIILEAPAAASTGSSKGSSGSGSAPPPPPPAGSAPPPPPPPPG
jgi:hypothetical protein